MTGPRLISIAGQTATGKTSLALSLADQLLETDQASKVILLSADSKQVFQGLEILTGTDVPAGFERQSRDNYLYPFFASTSQSIELHGVSIISGDEEWSVAHFEKLFHNLYGPLDPEVALLVVGGTGLYQQQLVNPAETTHIKPDQQLRNELEQLGLDQLQKKLAQLDPQRWAAMNHSDRQNPRRLIRAIEIAQVGKNQVNQVAEVQFSSQLGLQLDGPELEQAIEQRVGKRLAQGVIEEVTAFEKKYSQKNLQAKTALGYQLILDHLAGQSTLEELQQTWTLEEVQYAKRQQTWWKKQLGYAWLESNQASLEEKAWEIIIKAL